LYAALGLGADSLHAALKRIGGEAMFSIYAQGSQIVHGSTFRYLVHSFPTVLLFRAFEGDTFVAPESQYIVETIMAAFSGLMVLQRAAV
jgi:hypothetical protein